MVRLKRENCYRGTGGKCYVFGWQFGPVFVALGTDCDEALSEWDERHGTRVEPGDPDLEDYEGGIEGALECGDIRCNDGGTLVWVDHHEWMREFDSAGQARAFYNRFFGGA